MTLKRCFLKQRLKKLITPSITLLTYEINHCSYFHKHIYSTTFTSNKIYTPYFIVLNTKHFFTESAKENTDKAAV